MSSSHFYINLPQISRNGFFSVDVALVSWDQMLCENNPAGAFCGTITFKPPGTMLKEAGV
jgi:hypothetical protein